MRIYRYLIIFCYIFNTRYFFQNKFGYACKICDRLWFEGDLKNLIHDSVEFVRTFLQNVFTSAVWSQAHKVFFNLITTIAYVEAPPASGAMP